MKGITGVIVGAIIILVVAVGGIMWYQQTRKSERSSQLYVGITDATANISNVNDIQMNVKKVEVHSASQGWVTVSSTDKAYELIELHAQGKTKLYAKANVAADTYDKVRVTVGDVVIRTKNHGNVKASKSSSYIVIDSAIKVLENADSLLKIDVMADKSLHTTTDGKYVFAAVVDSEGLSNAKVDLQSDDSLSVTGGTEDSNVMVGVDLDGTSKTDFQLHTDDTLKVDSGVGGVKFMLDGKTYIENNSASGDTESQSKTKESSDTNASVNASSSVQGSSDSVNGNTNVNVQGGIKIGQ